MRKPYATYKCVLCGQPAGSKNALALHLRREHNEKPGVFFNHLMKVGGDRNYSYIGSFRDRMDHQWRKFKRSVDEQVGSPSFSSYRADHQADLKRRQALAARATQKRRR